MTISALQTIANATKEAIRSINDVKVDILGSSIYYIRVSKGEEDSFGYYNSTYTSGVIDNVIMNYPINEIEMFDQSQNSQADTDAVYLDEILPITILTKFAGSGVLADGLEEGDILVDVIEDEHDGKVPIKLQVVRQVGGFNVKYLVTRTYELSLVRGLLDDAVETAIAAYVVSV